MSCTCLGIFVYTKVVSIPLHSTMTRPEGNSKCRNDDFESTCFRCVFDGSVLETIVRSQVYLELTYDYIML